MGHDGHESPVPVRVYQHSTISVRLPISLLFSLVLILYYSIFTKCTLFQNESQTMTPVIGPPLILLLINLIQMFSLGSALVPSSPSIFSTNRA